MQNYINCDSKNKESCRITYILIFLKHVFDDKICVLISAKCQLTVSQKCQANTLYILQYFTIKHTKENWNP